MRIIIIVWLFVNAGQSLFIAVLFHMTSNAVWGLFPDFDPYYDPRIMCLILLAPVMAIVCLWGPTMLGRFGRCSRPARAMRPRPPDTKSGPDRGRARW